MLQYMFKLRVCSFRYDVSQNLKNAVRFFIEGEVGVVRRGVGHFDD